FLAASRQMRGTGLYAIVASLRRVPLRLRWLPLVVSSLARSPAAPLQQAAAPIPGGDPDPNLRRLSRSGPCAITALIGKDHLNFQRSRPELREQPGSQLLQIVLAMVLKLPWPRSFSLHRLFHLQRLRASELHW